MADPSTPLPSSQPDPMHTSVPAALPDLARSIELVREVQAGRRQALNELFERYEERVRRIASVRMGSQLRRLLETDDVVQDVFMVAAQKIEEFEPQSHASILRWLATIVENQLRDQARYHGRQKRDAGRQVHLHSPSSTGAGPELASEEPTPSERSAWAEIEEIVDESLQGLEPEAYREVILLRDYYGCGWEEVQSDIGRPTVGAAQELYRRAHAKLRNEVARRMGKGADDSR